jgi:membrane peptidoglycan carboxypeptidase
MVKVSQVIRLRQHRYEKANHRPWLKLGILGALLFSLVFLVLSFTSVGYAFTFTHNLPSVEVLPSLLEPPDGMLLQPSRIYDRSGQYVLETLQNPAAAGKQYLYVPPAGQVNIDRASPYLINATILEFDPDFWTNPGFKLDGIVQGSHSTLAQVLVSNLVLFDEPPSLVRNIRERILAAQLTSTFGRNKILEW